MTTRNRIAPVACGPTVQSSASPRSPLASSESRTRPADLITADELRGIHGHNAADAIRQLRPAFLRADRYPITSTIASVYVNDRYAGGLEVLELLPLPVVTEIRYADPVVAKNMFGSYCRCDRGVVFVRTRVESRR